MTDQHPLVQTERVVVPAVTILATDETALFPAPFDLTVTSVTYIPDAAIAGADDDTRKVSVRNAGQGGAGVVEVAALQFDDTIDGVEQDEKAILLSGTAEDLDAAAGDVLIWRSEAVGTGLADPGGTVVITFSRR